MPTKLKIAAIGDLHIKSTSSGEYREVFKSICQQADILVLCGDLTEHGEIEEAQILAGDLNQCTLPVVGVLGNHDYHKDRQHEIREILKKEGKMVMLDEEPFVYQGVGFAGVKGFCGGFGQHMLAAFGEQTTKDFVGYALQEALKLETLLKDLETEKKVVILHYSPIVDTIIGEPVELYPFLGSSRLEEPINNFGVSVVFHGHTHHGKHRGVTKNGTLVYNVSSHILKEENPAKPYIIVEV